MRDIDIILGLLEGAIEIPYEYELKVLESNDKDSILNLLALSILNKDLDKVIEITDTIIKRGLIKVTDEQARKVLEYRLLAFSMKHEAKGILETLRFLREKILYLSVFPYPFMHLSSLEDLLDEQKLLFIKRQTLNISHYSKPPISGLIILSIYRNLDLGRIDHLLKALSKEEISELLSYVGVLLAYVSRAHIGRHLIGQAIELADSYIARVASGVVNYLLNNYRRAFNEFMVALNLLNDRALGTEALVNVAQLYLLTGEYSLALNYITHAIRRNPNPFSRFIRGLILLNLRRINEAIVAFKALLGARDKQLRIHALLGLAECYLVLKSYSKAFEVVWKAHMLNPFDKIVSMYAEVLKRLSESRK